MALTSFTGPGTICSGEATPIEVQLTNWGADTLFAGDAQALTVQMAIDGEVALSSDWSGELSTYASASFTLGTYMFDGSTDFTLEVLVEDEGPGIAKALLPRIFDPFFTTKSTGTGLGLSLSYDLAEQLGGSLSAGNREGGGACFSLWLPSNPPMMGAEESCVASPRAQGVADMA